MLSSGNQIKECEIEFCICCKVPIKKGSFKYHKRGSNHIKLEIRYFESIYSSLTNNYTYQRESVEQELITMKEELSINYPSLVFRYKYISRIEEYLCVSNCCILNSRLVYICFFDGKSIVKNDYTAYNVVRCMRNLVVLRNDDYYFTDNIQTFKNLIETRCVLNYQPDDICPICLDEFVYIIEDIGSEYNPSQTRTCSVCYKSICVSCLTKSQFKCPFCRTNCPRDIIIVPQM